MGEVFFSLIASSSRIEEAMQETAMDAFVNQE